MASSEPAIATARKTDLVDDRDADGLDRRTKTGILGVLMRRRLRPLLGDRVLARLIAVAAIARLHVGGMGLCVLLLVEDATDSLASAGLAAGALSLGVGLTRPLQGRLLDRAGARALTLIAAAHSASAVVLLGVVAAGAAPAATTAAAFLSGFTTPALSVVTRAVCAVRVPARDRPAVLGIDNALLGAAFMVGPLIGGALAATFGARAAIAALLVVGCGGTVVVAALAPLARRTRAAPPLSRPALRPIVRPLLASIAQGLVYGAVGVAGAAAAFEAGGDHLAGPIVAALFAGGLAGDLLLSPRNSEAPLDARMRARTAALLLAVAFTCVAPSLALFVAAVAACGAALATVGVTILLDVAGRARSDARAEAFGWAGASMRVGDAVGAATAGVLAEHLGFRGALFVALLGAVSAAGAAIWSRARRLRSVPA